ncbi:MAG TPA: tetratricopeptide repeat protein [Sulfurospirillum arcachonense]|nr:tetratricopeptide repeat protein [Sulfurospirillum arcachonense]HIP44238.1 tetratricopeptide repeat protein [Sulfurospirillum arcachonense]
MKKIITTWLIVTCSLLANEPSVYGAGNLDSANPYGLTSSEKHILKNSDKVKDLAEGVGSVKIKLNRINENYEGLRSVTEAFGSKIAKVDKKIFALQENSTTKDTTIAALQEEVLELKTYVNESRALQDANQEKIKLVLGELSSLIDSINNNYVSKESFSKLEAEVTRLQVSKKVSSVSTKSGATLLKEGTSLFNKKSYSESKLRFTQLIKKNYKPARSNFYLGEIAYFQKSYTTAIEHYKKSISLYDKADYMPVLLYHTGISFSKLKKSSQATQFFNALKQSYPDSKEAKSIN